MSVPPVKTILDKMSLDDIGQALTKVDKQDCWDWTGSVGVTGYGYLMPFKGGKQLLTHRVMFALYNGREPGKVLDHLCRNRACCNPKHLEEVTAYENMRRGMSIQAQLARRTKCKHGHEYTPENTLVQKNGRGRNCRTCARRASNALYYKKKEDLMREAKLEVLDKLLEQKQEYELTDIELMEHRGEQLVAVLITAIEKMRGEL